jgi:hypothetical protein
MSDSDSYVYQYPGLNKNTSFPSKVQISISCSNLPKFDAASKSDPKVFIFIESKCYIDGKIETLWSQIAKTETVKNNVDPTFKKKFTIDYYFETIQNLRFVVFDMDGDSKEWKKNDFIGYVEKSLASLINESKNNVVECDILTSKPSGIEVDVSKAQKFSGTSKMFIRIEEDSHLNKKYRFNVQGVDLDKKDIIGSSDPFIIISRIEDDGSIIKVMETSVIKNTLNPAWANLEVPVKTFNNEDLNKMLLFEVLDWDKNSKNDIIGTFKATTKDLIEKKSFEVINEKKKSKSDSYKNSGTIIFDRIEVVGPPLSFMDFPMGGTEIVVTFAIDFTGSNGLKHLKSSLHYNNPEYDINNFYTMNDYEKAISSIGYVLEPYDSNKSMEVYGYGGKFFGRGNVEFDCPLTDDREHPSVIGVAGILEAYHNALQTVKLSGPTNFAPIIKKITNDTVKDLPPPYENNPLPKYHILAIITDGVISDINKTIEAIIDASDHPLSIIIIGVGKENFEKMNVLDGDNRVLKMNGKNSKRDIVQFLPLNKFIENPDLLRAETLKEVPKQVIEFANKYKYKPNFHP